jgi:DNA-binding protein YbaB
MDLIDLAEDREMWRDLVKAAINLAGNFLTS